MIAISDANVPNSKKGKKNQHKSPSTIMHKQFDDQRNYRAVGHC